MTEASPAITILDSPNAWAANREISNIFSKDMNISSASAASMSQMRNADNNVGADGAKKDGNYQGTHGGTHGSMNVTNTEPPPLQQSADSSNAVEKNETPDDINAGGAFLTGLPSTNPSANDNGVEASSTEVKDDGEKQDSAEGGENSKE